MAPQPKRLTGDKEEVRNFVDKFDVGLYLFDPSFSSRARFSIAHAPVYLT